jgi:hypothetical protein
MSWHFLYPTHNPVEYDYLRYTPNGVKKLLEYTGFDVQTMTPRRLIGNPELMYQLRNIEGMREAQNYDKHDWCGCLTKAKKKYDIT